jgi:hypothetical protein
VWPCSSYHGWAVPVVLELVGGGRIQAKGAAAYLFISLFRYRVGYL